MSELSFGYMAIYGHLYVCVCVYMLEVNESPLCGLDAAQTFSQF